jgi:ABC-type nitrate/sulfonate/bicarbonate transport system ATPase subunit
MRNDLNLNNIIEFEKVGKIFEPQGDVALRDISFTVKNGEFVCIIGPSGCGKSTVLNIISGLEKESSGNVVTPKNISMVFQSGALFPWLNVYDNVAIGLRAKDLDEIEVKKISQDNISMMGLSDYIEKFPRELSGGQRQRVGIARALAVNPEVLLLDEPFSALDAKMTEELHQDVLKIWGKTKITIVMVSHSIEEATGLADRVILMKNGSIDQEFKISLPHPRHEQAENFIHEVNDIRRRFFK